MDLQLFVLCALTFIIHLIGTLAYAVRIAGVRTGRIAVCFALFNILVLVSRTSNSFQGPFLAKRIEENISQGVSQALLSDFRWLLLSATLATLVGAFLIPMFQRLFAVAVSHFQIHRSVPRLLIHSLFKGGIGYVRDAARLPAVGNVSSLRSGKSVSAWVVGSNVLAVALWTIGVFAALYAGCLNPELRVTASRAEVTEARTGPLPLVGMVSHRPVHSSPSGKGGQTAFSESCSVWFDRSRWCCLDTGRTLAYSFTMQFPDIHRITLNPDLMGGKPCIRGMRVTVGTVTSLLASGMTHQEILAEYPYLEEADIRAALMYASWRSQEMEVLLESA